MSDTVPVQVAQTVHIPGHGVVYAGTEETVPDSPAVSALATAGALKKQTAKSPDEGDTKTKTGANASSKEEPAGA